MTAVSGAVPPASKREQGVLYQHPLYDKAFYEHLTAIEVHGIRFVRDGSMPERKCPVCGAYMVSEE